MLIATYILVLSAWSEETLPTIERVQNAASFSHRGVPGSGIAPGSVFAISGSSLGPEEGDSVEGIAIHVSGGGVTLDLAPLAASPVRLTAILPDDFPPGEAVFTVTYAGVTSDEYAVAVPARSFGLATVNGTGRGTAVAHDAEGNPYTLVHSANAGEILILEGTGFGAASDDTQMELYFGDAAAEVHSHGPIEDRPGWIRIEATVPEGVEGCHVAVYVKLDGTISNTPTVPVAASGERLCRDLGFLPDNMEELYSREHVTAGFMSLGKVITHIPGSDAAPAALHVHDSANAGYIQSTLQQYTNFGGWGEAAFGSCVVWSTAGGAGTIPPAAEVRYLNAGASLHLALPDGGHVELGKDEFSPTYVYSSLPPVRPNFIPDAGGPFTFYAPGGEEVEPHEATIDALPRIEWTNREGMGEIDRAQDLAIDWSPGEEGDYIVVSGASSDGAQPDTLVTEFSCTARANAGHVTVPAAILSAMVPSFEHPAPIAFPTGQLSLRHYRKPQIFSVPGFDAATINSYTWEMQLVRFH